MRKTLLLTTLAAVAVLLMSCDKDVDGDNSSAKVAGYVYLSPQDATGIAGVQIILESDANSEDPYQGPDRWTETDENGYYEIWAFLGDDVESGNRDYRADFLMQYFYQGARIDSVIGVTLSPGSVFTMPPRYVN